MDFDSLPKLLTIEQVSEILGIHPNTLRNWDAKGRLKAVRLGSRRDRRFDRDSVRRLYVRPRSIGGGPTGVRFNLKFPKISLLPGAIAALMIVIMFPASIFGVIMAQAKELHRSTVSLEPATCTGWDQATKAQHIDVLSSGAFDAFTAENSTIAVRDPDTDTTNNQQDTSAEELDAPAYELVCTGFTAEESLRNETDLNQLRAVFSLGVQSDPQSEDIVSLSYSLDGTTWTSLDSFAAAGEVSNATNGGYREFPFDSVSFDSLGTLSLRVQFHEGVVALPAQVSIDGMRVDATVSERPTKSVSKDITDSVALSEESYDADEIPQVNVKTEDKSFFSFLGADPTVRTIQSVEVIDPGGTKTTAQFRSTVEIESDGITTLVALDESNFSRPGRYQVTVTVEQDGYIEQVSNDFWWGVLAVNIRRSIGLPDTYTEIGVATLDDKGRTVCDAEIQVTVSNPDGKQEVFTTNDKTVVVNPTCADKSYTMQPDYAAYFTTSGEGRYTVAVEATTKNGTYRTTDSFEVRTGTPFDVERSEFPTRIYPPATYPVYFTVTPTEDFQGTVREEIPESFAITEISDKGREELSSQDAPTKYIQWNVDWKKGKAYTLRYTLDAPDVSPEYYRLGPLAFYNSSEKLKNATPDFAEARSWQIASDSVGSATSGRLWTNGFELYTAGSTPTAGVEYTSNINSPLADTTTKRSGAASLETLISGVAATEGMKYTFSGPTGAATNLLDDVYYRAYVYITSYPSTLTSVVLIENAAGTDMASIRMNTSTGALELWNDEDNVQVGLDSSGLNTGQWYRLELRTDCTGTCAGAASATLDARIDGVSFASATNINWASGISGFSVGILSTNATGELNWDDLAINDDSSTDVNWPGDGKVVYSRPDGNGTNVGWTGGDFTAVDDVSASDATYTNCTDGSATETEDYTLQGSATLGITAGDNIKLLQPYVRMGAGAVNAHDLTYRLIVGSDQDASASLALNLNGFYNNNDDGVSSNPTITSFDYPGSAATTNDAWTTTTLDSAFIQIASTDCTPNTRISEIWIAVEYVPQEGGRLWTSGFELQSATAGVEYDANVNAPSISTTTYRYGVASLRTNPTTSTQAMGVNFATADTQDDFYFRAYFRMATMPNANTLIMAIRDNAGTNQASIRYDNTNNTLELWNEEDGVQVGSDSTVVIQANRWYMLEVKVDTTTLASTALDARIDNISFASGTVNHANGVRTLQLGVITTNATADIFWDDVAINEGIGSTQNTFPGPGAVVNMQVDSAGDNTGWTGDNTAVDEITPNDATDAVTVSTVNTIEDDNLESSANAGIGANDSITLVHAGVRFNLSAAGTQGAVNLRLKDASGGFSIESNPITVNSTTWYTNNTARVIAPITAYTRPNQSTSWTQSALDSAQVGVRLVTDPSTNNFQVSTMWLTVEYIPKISVSGILRDSTDVAMDCNALGNVNINVSTQAGTARTVTCTAVNGTFSLYADAPNNAGDPLLMYDGYSGLYATTLIMAANTTSAISDFNISDRWLILRNDSTGSITNAILTAGHNGSVNIGYTMSSGNVTTPLNYGIRVNGGDTYDPGGTITTNSNGDFWVEASATAYFDTATTAIGRDILVDGGATMQFQATTTIAGGDITTSGTSAVVNYSGTPLVTISGTGSIGGGTTPSITFYSLTISGTQTLVSGIIAWGDLTVDGTMNGSVDVTVVGNIQGIGTVTMTGGTVTQYAAVSRNFGTTSGVNAWSFVNLTFRSQNGSSTITITTNTGGSGGITISGRLLVSEFPDIQSTVLNAGNRTWTLSNPNEANPFDVDVAVGSLTASTSTFVYSGDNDTGDVTIEDATFYKLTLGGSVAENYNPEGAMGTNNDLTVNANGTLIGTFNIAVSGNFQGTGTVTMTGGTVTQWVSTADKAFGTTSGTNVWTFVNLSMQNASGTSTRTITTNTGGTGGIEISGVFIVAGVVTQQYLVLDAGNRTWTLSNPNSANPFDFDSKSVGLGSLTGNTSTFVYSGDNDTGNVTVENANFNNLTLGGGVSETFVTEGDHTISGTLTVNSGHTFSIGSGHTVSNTGSSNVAGTGTISGAGTLRFTDTSGGPGTTITTLSSIVRFDATGANVPTTTVDARTYGGAVEFYSNVAAVRSITFPAGTFVFSSNFSVITGASQSEVLTVDASNAGTSNPTIGITGNLTFTNGGGMPPAITSGTGTWTVTGNVDFSNGTYTATSGNTLLMDGSSNLIGNSQTLNHLTINGANNTVTVTTSDVSVSGTLTIGGAADANNDTLSISVSRTLYSTSTGTITLIGSGTDTISGAGLLDIRNSNLGTGGTLSVDVRFNHFDGGTITMPARAYGGDVESYLNRSVAMPELLMGAGTHTITGNFSRTVVGNLSHGTIVNAATNDPTVTIGGNLISDYAPGGAQGDSGIDAGAGTWTVSGNVDTNTLLGWYAQETGGKLVMDGTSKTLDLGADYRTSIYDFTSSGTITVISNSLDVNHDLVISAGTLTAPASLNLTVGNNFTNNSAFTHNSGTVIMDGAAGAINGSAATTFNNLTIDGTNSITTVSTSNITVNGTLTIGGAADSNNDTLSIDTGRTVTSGTAGTVTFVASGTDTISGAGTLIIKNSNLDTDGTLSANVQFDTSLVAGMTMPARSYGANVEVTSNRFVLRTVTIAAGTVNITGNLTLNDTGSAGTNLSGTNNPTVNITGSIGCSATTSAGITTGNAVWTVSTNVNLTNCTVTATSGNTLVMNGTGLLTTSGNALQNLTLSGTVTLANETDIIAGNLDMTGGTITAGTSTVIMTGTSNTIVGGGATLNNLTIDPSSAGIITLQTSDLTVSGTVNIASGDTLAIDTNRTLTHTGSTLTLTGILSGPGRFTYRSVTTFPTGGTLSGSLILRFDAVNTNQVMPVRTDYQNVEIDNSGTTAGRTVTPDVGTITLAGTLDLLRTGSNPGTTLFEMNTNDPTFTVGGAITVAANTTLSANSANAFNMNGNYTNSGTFSDNGGTVTVGGSSQQTFSGTMTGSSDFNSLTVTNSSGSNPDTSPSVIFSSGATTAGSFTATTANTKLRFLAGGTFTFQNIGFNGQATGTRVYLRSSSIDTQWNINVAGTRSVSNTDVRDSNACGQAPDIDASDGTNFDAGDNSCWFVNSITFSISDTTIGFGSLSSGAAQWATGDLNGSATDVAAHTLSVATNARNGYVVTYSGPTLSGTGGTIDAATIANDADGTQNTEQFAMGFSTNGDATIAAGYDHNATPANRDWNFIPSTTTTIASEIGSTATETISAYYLANITGVTEAGVYSTNVRYVMTSTF